MILSKQIDQMVYKLYDLTPEEIEMIGKSVFGVYLQNRSNSFYQKLLTN